VVLLILVSSLVLVLIVVSVIPCPGIHDQSLLVVNDRSLLLVYLLDGGLLFRLLMELLLFLLVELLLVLDDWRTELLSCGSPDAPWVDRGRHPRPWHGTRDGESRGGLTE
jgi:hypothetical protein